MTLAGRRAGYFRRVRSEPPICTIDVFFLRLLFACTVLKRLYLFISQQLSLSPVARRGTVTSQKVYFRRERVRVASRAALSAAYGLPTYLRSARSVHETGVLFRVSK